jgi:hypothetical protein
LKKWRQLLQSFFLLNWQTGLEVQPVFVGASAASQCPVEYKVKNSRRAKERKIARKEKRGAGRGRGRDKKKRGMKSVG